MKSSLIIKFVKSILGKSGAIGVISFLVIILYGCSSSIKERAKDQAPISENGKVLMENKCFSCHNTQNSDNMLAPPMQRVKDHYLDDETSREEFIKAIVEWCKNPTEDKSLMPGARQKFGLMPKQEFDLAEIAIIASYLYENDLQQTCSHD